MDKFIPCDDNSTKMWLDFIKNRIDRKYAKLRASGITTCILFSVVFYLVSKGMNVVFGMHDESTRSFFLLSLATFSNLLWPIFTMISFLISISETKKTKILFGVRDSFCQTGFLFFLLLFGSVCFLNLYIIFTYQNIPDKIFYYFFSCFYILIILGIVNELISSLRYGFTIFCNKYESNNKIIFLRIIFHGIIFCYAFYFCTIFFVKHNDSYESIESTWSFILSAIIIIYIALRSHSDKVINTLQNLEEKIIFKKISINDIENEYISITNGYEVSQWCASKELEMKSIMDKISEDTINITNKLQEINAIDNGMKYEIRGRLREALESFEKNKNEYNKFMKKILMQLKKLKYEISDDDMKHLMHVVDVLEEHIKSSKDAFHGLQEKVKALEKKTVC